ncbi:MAG: TolC family protein [Bacteroidota bacterium]|jgi:outer membrane protein TolC|nr:TolC family protein [Bacteroidota bacterium]
MNKLPRYFFCVWMLFPTFSAMAQDGIESLSPDDYLKLQLPPLEVLFENAKNSAAVDFYTVKMEEEASALKTEKRSWLKYFRVGSTYQWGLMGINSSFSDIDTPLFYQYSGSRQSWYNIGATLSIPLDDFFDRGNRITRQELKTKATRVEMEKWHDEQKLRIIEKYTKAVKELSVLKLKAESLSFANARFELAQQDFMNGNIQAGELSQVKSIQMNALEAYEQTRAELNMALLQLEVLAKTKILNR